MSWQQAPHCHHIQCCWRLHHQALHCLQEALLLLVLTAL
jgi:hypothetical protein